MNALPWIISVVVLLLLVRVWYWRRDIVNGESLKEEPGFLRGCSVCEEDCKTESGLEEAKRTVASNKRLGAFTPFIFGYACKLAEIMGEPHPKPWRKPQRKSGQSGFTFIETLIAIAIIVIIAVAAGFYLDHDKSSEELDEQAWAEHMQRTN